MIAEKYKALLLVGGPGSGKDIVLRTIFKESNVLELNLEQVYKACIDVDGALAWQLKKIDEGIPIVINGTAVRDGKVQLIRNVLEEMGYQTKICIVYSSNESSKSRNDARITSGIKTISEEVRTSKWVESYNFIRSFDGTDAIIFDNSKLPREMVESIRNFGNLIKEFFERKLSLDEAVSDFLDENFKNDRQAHRALELSVEKPKSGLHAYHNYNASKKKTKSAAAPVSPQSPESSEGAYLSTESKKFKDFRKQAKPPTNTQYVGDPQGVGGATADLREEKKPNKSKSAKPPAINADARVGDDQAVVTTLGMTGEQTELKHRSLKKLREQITNKSPDGEFLEKEVYEDIGLDGNKGIYEGRAIVTNKPFRRGNTYSVYVDKNGVIERMDFPNKKRVLEEIFDALTLEAKES